MYSLTHSYALLTTTIPLKAYLIVIFLREKKKVKAIGGVMTNRPAEFQIKEIKRIKFNESEKNQLNDLFVKFV